MAAASIECVLARWPADRPALERIRRQVFVEEQGIPENEEFDSEDAACIHVLARLNRDPVGTGRLNPAGKIARIAVVAGHRGRGTVGRRRRALVAHAVHFHTWRSLVQDGGLTNAEAVDVMTRLVGSTA